MMCIRCDELHQLEARLANLTNFELDPVRFSKYTFYRAILENTAMVTKGHLDLVREATEPVSEIIFAGGASRAR